MNPLRLLLSVFFFTATLHAAELWEKQDAPAGALHEHTYLAASVERERPLLVYTPPGYETSGIAYPLLVLAHGRGDNHRSWTEKGNANLIYDNLIARQKAVPAVILMIDGHQPFKDNGSNHHVQAMEAYRRELMEDAIPFVEKHYRLLPGSGNRAIAGLSMGGRQSVETAFRHPDRFAWVGSFSGAHSPDPSHYQPVLANVETYNSSFKLLWIACGKQDPVLARNQPHIDLFRKSGLVHEWHLTEGAHTWDVWRVYLTEFAPRLFTK